MKKSIRRPSAFSLRSYFTFPHVSLHPLLKKPRKRRSRRPQVPSAAPPVGLVLVSCAFVPQVTITMRFDQPINVDNYDGNHIRVYDGDAGLWYSGTGLTQQLDEFTFQVELAVEDEWTGVGAHLDADSLTGIVGADSGNLWAGVENVTLPFP